MMTRFLSVRFTAACARMFLLITSLPISLQLEPCGSFGGLKEKNFVLPGYTFDSSYTGDSFSCADRCFSHEQCKSYNFALSGPQQGSCELNSVGRFATLRPLQYRPGFVFVDVVTRKPVSTSSSCWVISSVGSALVFDKLLQVFLVCYSHGELDKMCLFVDVVVRKPVRY